MFSKVLVANRGEIAVRAFRAAVELGAQTVAVFPWEDRNSLHRLKADQSFQIGETGHPVRAYLSVEEILEAARTAGADAVYPGYGFLSENPDLAEGCARAGITFVGPPADILELAGNKARAIAAARAAGLPVMASSEPSADLAVLVEAAGAMEFPVFVKAVAGGGGRGMRRVGTPAELPEALGAAMREAEAAFGDPAVYLEQAVVDARHIEVQVLADAAGNVIHLFDRDCSVQRRHQKVVELAPAPHLDPELRQRICADAVAFARAIGYVNAGTVEFLVDQAGRHVFIEMNPRIQVEHTVTEEVTDVDLVQAQLRIAAGETLPGMGLSQDAIVVRGAALQCRITTEDPPTASGLPPAASPPTGHRAARASGWTAALPSAPRSRRTSTRCWSSSPAAAGPARRDPRARRALAEFRIRGVPTNIAFLHRGARRSRLPGRPGHHLLHRGPPGAACPADLRRPGHQAADLPGRRDGQPPVRPAAAAGRPRGEASPGRPRLPAARGSRQRLRALGPEEFARELRRQPALAVTDTTFRDAHQSLLATRVRSRDLLAVAGHVARSVPQLLSLEAWGGATYDVALRYLHEDPWERLAALSEAVPNICLQMLLRGRNTVGYTPYPETVTEVFVREAAAPASIFSGSSTPSTTSARCGRDRRRPQHRHRRRRGSALLHRGPVRPGRAALHPGLLPAAGRADRQRRRPRPGDQGHGRAAAPPGGSHAGHRAAGTLRAARPPAHPRHRRRPARHPAGRVAGGADAVDGAVASMAGTTSQPPLSAIVAATDHTDRATGLSLRAVNDLEPYWEGVRRLYAPFESGLPSPTGRVYSHEIPGGQLSNLRQQAIALGLGQRFEDVETPTPPPTSSSAGSSRSPRHRRPSATWRCNWSEPVSAATTLPATPASTTCPTRSSGSSAASSATRREAGPSRSAPPRSPAAARPARLRP
jgi:pyruvate carboxylase